MMTGSGERSAQARQRSEDSLRLASAVLFRRAHCLGIGGFRWCVLIRFEVRVSQSGQCFFEYERIGIGGGSGRVDSSEPVGDGCPNVLNWSCVDANRKADCYRRDGDSEQGWKRALHNNSRILPEPGVANSRELGIVRIAMCLLAIAFVSDALSAATPPLLPEPVIAAL
jgi:hypothetical protein